MAPYSPPLYWVVVWNWESASTSFFGGTAPYLPAYSASSSAELRPNSMAANAPLP